MNKLITIALITCLYNNVNAQIGVNTDFPTEVYDLNGTVRIRSLPSVGTANSIYTTGTNTQSGITPTQTFNGVNIVYSDANGVMGRSTSTTSNLVPNNTATGFSSLNASTSMFVIRRFNVTDWPSGIGGFDTGMDLAGWEPVMSNAMFTIGNDNPITTIYSSGGSALVGYRMAASGTTWKIIGDINGVSEGSVVDVLFIKKTFVAADVRTN